MRGRRLTLLVIGLNDETYAYGGTVEDTSRGNNDESDVAILTKGGEVNGRELEDVVADLLAALREDPA